MILISRFSSSEITYWDDISKLGGRKNIEEEERREREREEGFTRSEGTKASRALSLTEQKAGIPDATIITYEQHIA